MPTLPVIFAPMALRDLNAIWDYLARLAGVTVAAALNGRILSEVARLADAPGIGHARRDVRDSRYRFWVVRPYVIAYRVMAHRLHVARVVHGARDFRRLFGRPS